MYVSILQYNLLFKKLEFISTYNYRDINLNLNDFIIFVKLENQRYITDVLLIIRNKNNR